MKRVFKKNKNCIICKGKITKYLSLGKTALANAYLTKHQLKKPEIKVPLEIYYCPDCHLSQLAHVVDRRILFENYAYFSSTSPQLLSHFDKYAEEVYSRFPVLSQKLVLEIASNDGILLKAFKKRGAKVLGIDPAKNIAKVANKDGINTIPDFFGTKIVPLVLKKYGKAGIITANNVLAHNEELHDIIEGAKQLLDDNGVFVFQAKYLVDLLEKNEFDTVYHEHVSYFAVLPLVKLLKMHDLEIFDIKHVETEGGSIRVYATHTSSNLKKNKSVQDFISKEYEIGINDLKTYYRFAKQPLFIKNKLVGILNNFKKSGKKIAGYGASAKGNTMLQYCKIGPKLLDYITDNAPSKQGKLTPGTKIPIVHPDKLKNDIPDIILILAWNYAPSIMEREAWFKSQGGKFIVPIPEPKII